MKSWNWNWTCMGIHMCVSKSVHISKACPKRDKIIGFQNATFVLFAGRTRRPKPKRFRWPFVRRLRHSGFRFRSRRPSGSRRRRRRSVVALGKRVNINNNNIWQHRRRCVTHVARRSMTYAHSAKSGAAGSAGCWCGCFCCAFSVFLPFIYLLNNTEYWAIE